MPLCAVQGDPNSHDGGNLIATNPQTVFINNIPVIDHAPDHAEPDGLCPGGDHCDPETAMGSPNVFYYLNPVHRMTDLRTCGAETIVLLQNNVFANEPGIGAAQRESTITAIGIPPSELFISPPAPIAKDDKPYSRTSPAPTRSLNKTAGTAPKNRGVSESKPIEDQPQTGCKKDGTTLSVIPYLKTALEEAKKGYWRETGQKGKPSNPNIINMWRNIGITAYTSDQTPWCAGFACFIMKQAGLAWIREANSYNLVNRLVSGKVEKKYKLVPVSQMRPGDLVLWTSGHVSFCYTQNNGRYTFVGGNQTPGRAATPPVRDPENDGDVTESYPGGWTPSLGGIVKVVRLDC